MQKNRKNNNNNNTRSKASTAILPSSIRSTRRTTLDPELASIPIPILPTSNTTTTIETKRSSYGRTLRKLQPLTANNSALPTMIDMSYSSSADLAGSSSAQNLSSRKSIRTNNNNNSKINEVSERNTGYYKDDNFECKVTPSSQRSNVVFRSKRRINIRPNTRASRR